MENKGFNPPQKLLYILLILGAVYILTFIFVFKPIDNSYSIFKSLPILDEEKVFPGYTLISPYNRLLSDSKIEGKVYLLDMAGYPVHTWTTNHQVLYSVLEPDGKLLSVMEQPKYSQFFPPGGNTGIIQELDWKSNVVWEYKNEAMHHDVAILPNGNLAFALWEKTPPEIARQIQGGVDGTEMASGPEGLRPGGEGGLIWSDNIVEINRKGETVWSWHSYEHMDPQMDVIAPLLPRYGWTYTNGLKYMEKNPIDGTPAYLLSMRTTSTVYIIRKEDGGIIWRSPKGMFSLQHDPTLLENGNILVFDNGYDRLPAPFPSFGSRAVEVNPKTNKVVWQFDAGEGPIDKIKFYAPIVGGAQRLSNGNTLITDGTRGHIFEVTNKGEVVWDIVSPYTTKQTGAFPNNFLFKSRRYGEDEIKWPQRIAPAFNKFTYNLHQILGKLYPR
ncbi:MAG: hypothetical protein A3C30_03025 [Candidatus Levybacteria bacterium RIFCSPHIGHO2_02_FULL_40_18]|nr:MAG: hypothetical protein A2869_04955 [Candidatus Levybacteria bacterium RIFCSPHIGHO2_01_FULL_40_58]OGH26948.1 MAG: hypothetical protein A3C30_03025 [Candidatus Levybacteria bacterium RIFCSPHIGHO2_02_FULL_40_18]OGH32070.1 MAG: hypothetical protein A3E43_04005 [Candidatus Levybacteria bacterium RIFCSPHIGHO2_12_FULL_40_31]OGH40808.1 MAG: hypothetical protein A2894_04395 [Candidatus Levybacteria bacterium RIFCSPLOWO2_01_FULL_40_64]OGH48664.1 MAG: hypothetical protein A3I54_03325 [Candidatus Lev